MPHLEEIVEGRVFDKKQRIKAENLQSNVTDENFVILTALHIDVLSLMASQSLIYQKEGSTIIGEYERQQFFAKNLLKLKSGETEGLKKFLDEVKCAHTGKQLQAYLTSNCKKTVKSCSTISNFEKNP